MQETFLKQCLSPNQFFVLVTYYVLIKYQVSNLINPTKERWSVLWKFHNLFIITKSNEAKPNVAQWFLTARLRWRGLRNGLFVVVVLVVVLGKLFWIPRKKWTYTVLLSEQRVHEISGVQSWSTKLVEINSVCPRT